MAKKKQGSNLIGWVLLGLLAFGIFQFGIMGQPGRPATAPQRSVPVEATPPASAVPLSAPRFVAVASLNVRHAPSTASELITALPRGTRLRVLDRQNGWLLVDLTPTLEGWVSERLTTTQSPGQTYKPPALLGSN